MVACSYWAYCIGVYHMLSWKLGVKTSLFSGCILASAISFIGCSVESDDKLAAAETTKEAVEREKLVIYTARKEHLLKPLIDRYEATHPVSIEYLTDKAGPLLAKIEAEGDRTSADIFMTVDAGNLWQAAERGVLSEVSSEMLNKNIPANLRDSSSRWYGLSVRARTVVYSTARVKSDDLSTYEGLADEKWKGRLCLRTSKKVYNQSLVATLIARLGEEKAESVVSGWVKNLATDVFSNDTKVMEAILAGQCDVGVVNTYYFGRLKQAQPDAAIALYWPNQDSSGVHLNVSGAGVTKHANNPEAALAFIEWLSEGEAQAMYAGLNQEYPANPAIKPSEEVSAWGEFKGDSLNVEQAGSLQKQAIQLMDRSGYR